MKINLQGNGSDMEDSRRQFIASTMATTHSNYREASVGNTTFGLPRLWDPSKKGMLAGNSGYGAGLDILNFDESEQVRRNTLVGIRNIMKTHPVNNACKTVYARYPVQGLKLQHHDKSVKERYEKLFLEDLKFHDFLIDMGDVFWTDGMAFPFLNWNDALGCPTGTDLLDPLDLEIERVPFVGEDIISLKPSDEMKKLASEKSEAGAMFRSVFPDLAEACKRGRPMPISHDRLRPIMHKTRPSDMWGTPVTLKAWNTLRLESRMQSAMLATADRLYAPLTLFTIGGTLPNGDQIIPSPAMLEAFRNNLDIALSSDFRAIITHSGVQSQEVFRQTSLSQYKNDWDMFDDRIFMAWGLSPAMLKPQSGNYATSSLEFQLCAQMLSTYQQKLVDTYNWQASLVAEAQGDYEVEVKGDQVTTLTERREVWDAEAGDGEGAFVIKDCPVLSYPKLQFDCVTPETGILTPSGIVAAGELEIGDTVISYDEQKSKFVIDEVCGNDRDEEPTLEVKTSEGHLVRCTKNHPFMTERGWVLAKDLTVDDMILKAYDVSIDKTDVKGSASGVSAEDAEFFGAIAAYGTITVKGVNFNSLDDGTETHIVDIIEKSSYDMKPHRYINKGCSTVQIFSLQHAKSLKEIFFDGEDMVIPNAVLKSDESVQLKFLDGYFCSNKPTFLCAKSSKMFAQLRNMVVDLDYHNDNIYPLVDTSYVLGSFIGDGSCGIPYVSMTGIVDGHMNAIKRAIDFVDCPYSIGHTGRAETWTIKRKMHRVNGAYLNPFVALFKGTGIHGRIVYQKRIPSYLFNASNAEKWAFIDGYVDTDGTITKSGTIRIDACRRAVLSDCQTLLGTMGISSKLAKGTNSGWYLTIRGKDRIVAAKKMRLQCEYKAEQLSLITDNSQSHIDTGKYVSVESVEDIGINEIVRLGIKSTHTYIADGLVTHNTINFRDEQKEREFLMTLRNAGVPISNEDISIGVDIDLDESRDRYNQERIRTKMDEALNNQGVYNSAIEQGVVVPPDVKAYMESGIAPVTYKPTVDEFRGEESTVTTEQEPITAPAPSASPIGQESDVRGRPYESDENRTENDSQTS